MTNANPTARANSHFAAKTLLILCASLLGYVANLFPLYLFSEMTLIIGPAFSLFVAMSLGAAAGALVAFISCLALVESWGHYYAFFLFIPEAIVMALLYRRGWNLLVAVTMYWLIVAIPFILVLIFVRHSAELAVDLVGKYLINGFIYTLLATTMNWFLSYTGRFNFRFRRSFTLQSQIFMILMVAMLLPIVGFSLYSAKQQQSALIALTQDKLKAHSQLIASEIGHYFQQNLAFIKSQAEFLSLTSDLASLTENQLSHLISEANDLNYLALFSAHGQRLVVAGKGQPLPSPARTTAAQSFLQAVGGEGGLSSLTQAHASPVIVVHVPIFQENQQGKHLQVKAVLEAGLSLEKLEKRIAPITDQDPAFTFTSLVTDAYGHVIQADTGFQLQITEPISFNDNLSAVKPFFYTSEKLPSPYLFQVAQLANRWQVASYFQEADFIKMERKIYHYFALLLAALVLVGSFLAKFLSSQINEPMNWLLARIRELNLIGEPQKLPEVPRYFPKEMIDLMRAQEMAQKRIQMAFETEKLHQERRIKAEKASEAKSEFLSSMSHELRTPLNAISGFSQLLTLDKHLDLEAKSLVGEIAVASQHLILLINDILDMSKIESGSLQLNQECVDLCDVVEQSLPLLASLAVQKEVTINCQHPPKRLMVFGDKLRLKQVMINLLSNAVKYNHQGGQVDIGLLSGGEDHVIIKVSDTGIGIPAEKMSQLFQVFNRLDNEGSQVEGYGIGLALTKKLVELMAGKIEVESEPGQGSSFFLYLKKDSQGVCETSRQDKPHSFAEGMENSIAPCRILYVEDNEINAMVMKKAMQHFPNIDYSRVASGQAAIDDLSKQSVDFLLMDLQLQDMSGFDLLLALRDLKLVGSSKLFAVSANAMPEDILKGKAAGFDEYVTKPVNFSQLFDLIRDYQEEA